MTEDAMEHYAGTVQSRLYFYWRIIEFWPQTKTVTHTKIPLDKQNKLQQHTTPKTLELLGSIFSEYKLKM